MLLLEGFELSFVFDYFSPFFSLPASGVADGD